MKYLTIIMGLLILPQIVLGQQQPSGCLVKVGKKVMVDPSCKCLEKNLCAKAKKFVYSDKFFETKDANNRNVFSSQEKKAYKESYELMNKIMDLKTQGKGKSPEIKKYYIRLEAVNAEIEALLNKNHPKMMAATKKRQAEQSLARKARNQRRDEMIDKFLEVQKQKKTNPSARPVAETKPAPVQPAVSKGGFETKLPPLAPSTAPAVTEKSSDELSNSDKELILKNIKKDEYNVNEDDSLFDIISKTYKSKAYKRLLEPTKTDEKSNP